MIHYQEQYQKLLRVREQMETDSDIQQFNNLLSKKDLTLQESRELMRLRKNKRVRKYSTIQTNINQIENPIDNLFFEKIAYIKNMGINPFSLNLSSDYSFPDGSSVYLWISSLVGFYMRHNLIKDEISTPLLQLYKQCVDYSSFSGRVQYLQFLLKFPEKDDFCLFLGIHPYLYIKLLRFNCNIKVIQIIISTLDKKDISFYSSLQQEEIKSFYLLLKRKLKSMPQEIEESSKAIRKNTISNNHACHLEELLAYVKEHSISSIPRNVKFRDGQNMFNWLNNLSKRVCTKASYVLSDEEIKKTVYKIAKDLYNDTTLPLYEGVSFNYGASLQRVILVYHIRQNYLFEKLLIPYTYLLPILQNKKFPNLTFIEKILSFLLSLPCDTMYQKEFVEEAIAVFTALKDIPIKGEVLDYTIYPADEENTYLENIGEVDISLLKRIKEQNYDWYMKCITLLFLYHTKNRTPLSNEFFYDGTLIFKWLLTQRKAKKFMEFSKEKEELVEILNKHFAYYSTRVSSFSVSHCDEILNLFESQINSYGYIQREGFYKTRSLTSLWKEFYYLLKREEPPFSLEQIKRYKELRYRVIYHEKMKRISQKLSNSSFNFGYELARLADGLFISVEKLGILLKINPSSLNAYSNNMTLPRLENLEQLLETITHLDVSVYREDQLEDIEHFKQFILDLVVYRNRHLSDFTMYYQRIQKEYDIFSVTGDISPVMIEAIKKEDSSWFKKYEEIYLDVTNDKETFCDSAQRIASFSWFKIETHKGIKGELSPLKQYFLCCLFYLRFFVKNKVTSFMQSFLVFETFVYENERLPMKDELVISKESEGTTFYNSLIEQYFRTSRNYTLFLPEEMHERIKNLMQYIGYLRRKVMTYRADFQDDTGLYLGERIDHVRIALRLQKEDFACKLGWNAEEFDVILHNRVALTEAQITSLLSFLEGQEGLREDHIRDITELSTILGKRKIDVGRTFHLSKKEENV